jgi:hypothetical protein
MNPRTVSRMSIGSSVPTERADSRASVCTSPPGSPCREHLESTVEPDVPCRIRTREGESSELRLRCMLSAREKYILDPCAWKLGAVQVMAHRHGMVKFINELRRDFGLNSRVTWKAVTYMDRYVCLTSSGESSGGMRERAELCAVVCLLLSCKFQERYFPSLPKLLEAISSPYTKEELKAAEVRALLPAAQPRSHTSPHACFPRTLLPSLLPLACAPTQLDVLNVLGWSLNTPSPHAAMEEMVNVLYEHHGEDLMPVVKHARTVIELSLWEPEGVASCTAPPLRPAPPPPSPAFLRCRQLLPFTLWWWPRPLSSSHGPCSCTARTRCQRGSVRACCVTSATSQQMSSLGARAS